MKEKSKSRSLPVSAAAVVLHIAGLMAQAKYAGGSGTAEDPYRIGTAEQMNAIGLTPDDWSRCFRLVADIDLKDLSGSVFHPIGNGALPFTGVFNGDGHKISSLTFIVTGNEDDSNSPIMGGAGLFRWIQGPNAVVENLGLVNPDIRPAATCPKRLLCVGALAGQATQGIIRNCYVDGGQVRGESMAGGLVGSSSATISDCHTTCAVQVAEERPLPVISGQLGQRASFGGLVGETYGALSNCWSGGKVSGDYEIGGLVGMCRKPAIISHCHAQAGVRGKSDVGGLVGYCPKGCSIMDCFACGSVSAAQDVGGLIGWHEGEASRCYATGCVVADANLVGGLVGYNGGTVSASWAGGNIRGNHTVGGLVGLNLKEDRILHDNPIVQDCYARGNVRGKTGIAGLIGGNQGGTVLRCYSTGRVRGETPDDLVSGLVCTNDSTTVKNSFWDIETSGLSTSDGGAGRTTAQMQNVVTFLGAGWDFVRESHNGTDDIWQMSCGRPIYPKLAWEPMLLGDFVDPEGVGFEDLAFLAQHWLQATSVLSEKNPDLNFDNYLDLKDFALLAQFWRCGVRKTIFATTLDQSPGWTAEGQWQFGVPAGRGRAEHGHPDPTRGYTGANVYGVNLQGDYSGAVDGPHYLTAGPFDGSLYRDVRLQFARWLNTDEADFVRATVEVSTDGTLWTTLWEQEDTEAILADDSWQVVEHSLGPMADHQESIYLRWGYEVLDKEAWPMSGWNIDDVVLTGVPE